MGDVIITGILFGEMLSTDSMDIFPSRFGIIVILMSLLIIFLDFHKCFSRPLSKVSPPVIRYDSCRLLSARIKSSYILFKCAVISVVRDFMIVTIF